ncbi:hypothetical protein FJ987_27990 [Mesorhizobium sp. CU2]|uniref:hypothetical protein n=1 Tax=unclassified Mesorhizobium TaxID=325217 RepID=UPI001126E730|nr:MULTISPECIES: hypothetical protein [unclassified Mesorhizobium]TPN76722.1 hypothetical protein FJ988_27625 [Mesorhizobium sp. CU3]TPO03222.1 hypothetical protein FJ987_27990 [Mesorhizobium sp. CU2]
MSLERSLDDQDEEPYDTAFFARKYGLSQRLAKTIIEANGQGRRACDAAATTYLRYIALRRPRGS